MLVASSKASSCCCEACISGGRHVGAKEGMCMCMAALPAEMSMMPAFSRAAVLHKLWTSASAGA